MADKKGKGKKGSKNKDEFDLSDLDDLDSGLDLGGLEDIDDDRKPTKAGVAKELAGEASKGFLDGLIKKTAKKSLNEEYEYNYSEAMDYADFGKETFVKSKSRVDRSLFKLGTEVKKILPFQSKMLDGFLEKYAEENAKTKTENEEAMREAGIQGNLASVFDRQLNVQKAIEARRDAKDTVASKERMVVNRISTNLLTSIDSNMAQQTAFTLQISKEYFKRSLELQYKSYFIQADMLKTMRDYYKGFSVQFDNIAKNTGLPDYVKLNNSERIGELIRNKTMDSVYKRMFSNNKYIEGIKKKADSYISEKLEEKLSGVDAISDQLDMLSSATDGPTGMLKLLGGVFAGMGGGALGEKLSDRISPKIRDKLKDNKYLNAGANKLTELATSPRTFFANLRNTVANKKEKYDGGAGLTDTVGSKVFGGLSDFLDVTNPGKVDYKVENDSVLNHNSPGLFTNLTNRSITEVIPMYLAKILKENIELNKMYLGVNRNKVKANYGTEELVYDYDKRKLTTAGDLRTNLETGLLSKNRSKQHAKSLTGSLMGRAKTELEKDKKGNSKELESLKDKKASKILEEYIAKATKLDVTQNYDTIIGNATGPNASEEVTKLINGDKELINLLKGIAKVQTKDSKRYIDNTIADVSEPYPIGGIKNLFAEVSRTSGKRINVISDNDAKILSKAFITYTNNTGEEVIIDTLLNGKAFMEVDPKDLNRLKPNLGILNSELRKIKLMNNIEKTSKIDSLLAVMNEGLRNSHETDPKVFQTLNDAYPNITGTGRLTVENLVEGKLKIETEVKDKLSLSDLRSITRPSKVEVEQNKTDLFKRVVESKLGQGSMAFISDLKEAGSNPFKLYDAVTKHATKLGKEISARAKEAYSKTEVALNELEKLSNFTDKVAKEALVKMIAKLTGLETSLKELIEVEQKTKVEKIDSLNELKADVNENINSDKTLLSIQKEITNTTKKCDAKIKVLNATLNNLTSQRTKLVTLSETAKDKSSVEIAKQIRDVLVSNISELKALIKEAAEAEAEEPVAA